MSLGQVNTPSTTTYVIASAIPLTISVGLLIFPRTRQAGAGLLLGMAVGTIAGAGLCIAILGAL